MLLRLVKDYFNSLNFSLSKIDGQFPFMYILDFNYDSNEFSNFFS